MAGATAATLQSTAEINATPTSYSPFGPDWSGASTGLVTFDGVYDGSPVSIPMFSTEISPVVGNVTHFTVAHSDIEFGAFVVVRQ